MQTANIFAFSPFFNFRDKEPTKDRPVKDDEFNALLMKLTDKETKTSSVKEGKQRPQKDAGRYTSCLFGNNFDAWRSV